MSQKTNSSKKKSDQDKLIDILKNEEPEDFYIACIDDNGFLKDTLVPGKYRSMVNNILEEKYGEDWQNKAKFLNVEDYEEWKKEINS